MHIFSIPAVALAFSLLGVDSTQARSTNSTLLKRATDREDARWNQYVAADPHYDQFDRYCIREALTTRVNWRAAVVGGDAPTINKCCTKTVSVDDPLYENYPIVRVLVEDKEQDCYKWEEQLDGVEIDKGKKKVLLQAPAEFAINCNKYVKWQQMDDAKYDLLIAAIRGGQYKSFRDADRTGQVINPAEGPEHDQYNPEDAGYWPHDEWTQC